MERTNNIARSTNTNFAHATRSLFLPEELSMGDDMFRAMSQLQSLGEELSVHVNEHLRESDTARQFSSILQNISDHYCRIAVIGQVKSGKSTFLNALIGRRGFLPTDVNPWTAVVTRLHFGRANLPSSGALFTFFDENEWEQIAGRGGRLRHLVEQFLPGYDSDRVGQHLREMRRRAEHRLGDQFYELLGKTHKFKKIVPAMLERYVCAGDANDAVRLGATSGRFADITKCGDVYLDSFPFSYPATVIDTPGTNDPLLIRDEITCQNIESADVFIVLLNAQQSFSTFDLALLRILQGLRKDKIIIFVNRIDQLSNVTNDTQKVLSHVRRMLQQEFPSVTFPIIAGSAHWGERALVGNDGEDNKVTPLPPALDEYAERIYGVRNSDLDPSGNTDDVSAREQERALLYTCSGIPAVAKIISKLMFRSMEPRSIGKISSSFCVIGDIIQTAQQQKLNSLESMSKDEILSSETHIALCQFDQISSLSQQIVTNISRTEDELEFVRSTVLTHLREELIDSIQMFAAGELEKLSDALEGGWSDEIWTCDTLNLRREMEDEFVRICREAVDRINSVERSALVELKNIAQQFVPELSDTFGQYGYFQNEGPVPSAIALS